MPQSPSPDLKGGIDTGAIETKNAAIEGPGGTGDTMDLNTQVHARVLRKLDWHLLPLVSLLYLLSFL